jgi:hypothetical protein
MNEFTDLEEVGYADQTNLFCCWNCKNADRDQDYVTCMLVKESVSPLGLCDLWEAK